jgi:hypothetical protein
VLKPAFGEAAAFWAIAWPGYVLFRKVHKPEDE